MKIAALSDLHGYLPDISKDIDLVLICGDIVPLHIQNLFGKCLEWFNTEFSAWSQNKNIILVWGNHDFVAEDSKYGKELSNILKKLGVRVLINDTAEYKGLKIYGTPHGEYCGWAFSRTPEQLLNIYNKIPEDIDILLTHTPPRVGEFDTVVARFKGIMHLGSIELRNAIYKKKPKYHLFGHIHEGDHVMKDVKGTKMVNVALKDDLYEVSYSPFIFEINYTI